MRATNSYGFMKIVDEETKRGFDLATGPLVRMSLIKLGDEEHVLTLVMHHIVSDGWSIEIIVREISQLYFAFAAGEPSPLSELPIQYADYAVWQRDWLRGEVLESRLQYWKTEFERAPELLELPADRARPSEASYRGASEKFLLSEELSAKLKQLSRREGVTLFMSLLAGFQLLLARYSGQSEIAVGTPVAGRNEVELEDLIGVFINTLAIRVAVDGNLTVRELLGRVRNARWVRMRTRICRLRNWSKRYILRGPYHISRSFKSGSSYRMYLLRRWLWQS